MIIGFLLFKVACIILGSIFKNAEWSFNGPAIAFIVIVLVVIAGSSLINLRR